MTRYMKFLVAALGAASYAIQAGISDSNITGTEGVGVVTAAVIAVLVLLVPNAPKSDGK